jgi:hypothetical protein
MATIPKKKPEAYKEDMKQNWLINSYARHMTDQFGFKITYGKTYTLYFKDNPITTLYSLQAAKLISTIILNDTIMNKPC